MKKYMFLTMITYLSLLIGYNLSAQASITFSSIPEVCSNGDTINLNEYVSPSSGVWRSQSKGLIQSGKFVPALAGHGTHWLIYEYQHSLLDSTKIRVRPEPKIQINDEHDLICEGDQYIGIAGIWNCDGALWYMDKDNADGSIERYINDTIIIYKPGKADLKRSNFLLKIMTVSENKVCGTAYDSILVNIINKPSTDFWAETTSGFAPFTVQFHDASYVNLYSTVCDWDFGDGEKTRGQNPIHTYTEPGIYSVTIGVKNVLGCSSYLRIGAFIHVWSLDVSEDIIENNLKIIPNPANGQAMIHIDEGKGLIKSARLFNSKGHLVKEYSNLNTEEFIVQREERQNGIYFINLHFDTGDIIKRKIIFQ